MAARPSIRALTKLTSATLPRRQLHMTGPATYPSPILTETRTSSSNPPSSQRPQASSSSSSSTPADQGTAAPPAARQFNTSRTLKAVNDTSTIDFFYMPELDADAEVETAIRVPLISGDSARAMHEDGPEETLRPLINLVSGGHIQEPSAMSEVVDNGSVVFEGMQAPAATKAAEPQDVGVVRQLWDGLLDDVFGPKKK